MAVGWALMFNTDKETTIRITAAMAIPAAFARIFAYIVPAAIMIQSMGASHLLPSLMFVNNSKNFTMAAVWSSMFGMALCVSYYYYPVTLLFYTTVLGTMITDCTFLYGYVLLKTTYSTVTREFTSPFGMTGAIIAILIYILVFISAGFYQSNYFPLKFIAGYLGGLSIYYHVFARKEQTLNEEEDHVFFKIHVRNFNMNKKNKRRFWFDRRKKKIAVGNYDALAEDVVNNNNHNSSDEVISLAPVESKTSSVGQEFPIDNNFKNTPIATQRDSEGGETLRFSTRDDLVKLTQEDEFLS